MYGAIFGLSLYAIGLCGILVYLVSVLAMLRIIGPSALPKVIDAHGSLLLWTKAVIQYPSSLCLALACLVFLLVPSYHSEVLAEHESAAGMPGMAA